MAGFGDIDVQPSPSGSVNKRKGVFVCELCGQHIESKPNLHNHINHHVSNPYKCQRCSKLFYYIHHFNKHMIDENNRCFECAECGKVFGIQSSWYNHMKIHKDIIYNCQEPLCKYSFRSKSRYKEHYKYFHRSSKTVKCRDCNQWFQTLSDRNNHKKSKHRYWLVKWLFKRKVN